MSSAEYEKKISELEKKILLLERKLNQDNLSRMLTEEALDRYHDIYRHTLTGLTKQKEELESARSEARERTVELESANLQLKIAKEKAEHSDRFKSEFLANMSHEIRSPMNAVLGYISLLEKTELNEIQSEYVKEIKTASEVLLFLVNDILDLSKIESGKMVFEDRNFDLRKIITDSASMNMPRARDKGIYITVKYDESIPEILKSDPMRLMQVLNNLISNAVKFTDAGGVTIQADHTGIFGNREKIFISVSDTGPGIKDEDKETVFEPFIQSKSVTGETTEGTGLGLSICKKILSQMGSEIHVYSEYGRGSKFYFELVLERGKPHEREQVNGTAMPGDCQINRDISILIVEDNPVSLRLFNRIIAKLGLSADTALNGHDAVKKSRNKAYNLILMDNILPEKSGYEAALEIRESGKSRNAIIIGISAGALRDGAGKLYYSAMNDFLVKPVKIDDVKDKIRKYFPGREAPARD